MENPEKLRVLVVDGLPLTRFALVSLIDLHPRVRVCDAARDVPEARRLCAEEKPDFVVLDLNLPRGSGLELLREVRTLHPPARALVYTEEEDALLVHRAFRAGAHAYLSKRDEAAELLSAIEALLAGERYTSTRVSRGIFGEMANGARDERRREVDGLSDRELLVFQLLGKKCGATAVARELGVSVKPIETHQERIKRKLKLRSCEELRRRAEQWIMTMDSRLPKRGKRTNGRSGTHTRLAAG